jgi:hypothetical protein
MHHRITVCSERESTNQIARFGGLTLSIPAISNAPVSEKQTPAQSLTGLFTDDYPKFPKFERHLSTIALINPRPA